MNTSIKGLGEVILRVRNLERCKKFYQEIIGLEIIREFPDMVFFQIAEGIGGHTQNLGLFRESLPGAFSGHKKDPVCVMSSSLHHFALEIEQKDYEKELCRLEDLNLPVTTAEHVWCHWRSIYVRDPEGNVIEFVCYDESVKKP